MRHCVEAILSARGYVDEREGTLTIISIHCNNLPVIARKCQLTMIIGVHANCYLDVAGV